MKSYLPEVIGLIQIKKDNGGKSPIAHEPTQSKPLEEIQKVVDKWGNKKI